jgi:hypothetical protein
MGGGTEKDNRDFSATAKSPSVKRTEKPKDYQTSVSPYINVVF